MSDVYALHLSISARPQHRSDEFYHLLLLEQCDDLLDPAAVDLFAGLALQSAQQLLTQARLGGDHLAVEQQRQGGLEVRDACALVAGAEGAMIRSIRCVLSG